MESVGLAGPFRLGLAGTAWGAAFWGAQPSALIARAGTCRGRYQLCEEGALPGLWVFGGPGCARLRGCLAGGWEAASPSPPHHLCSSRRGLKFMLVLLQSISDGERDEEHPNLIRVNAMKAYEIALKKYHGWMLQKLFMVSVPVSAEESSFSLSPAVPLVAPSSDVL